LNRYLQAASERSPLRGVAIARQMPRTLQGRAPSLAVGTLDQFALRGGASLDALTHDRVLGGAAADAVSAMQVLQSAIERRPAAARGGDGSPQSAFGQALREIARLAHADVGLEVAFTESGNWDHHAGEGGASGALANRLDDLSRGIAAFAANLGERMADTVIVTMSEFGRTVAENGTRGTDHGHGNAMLLVGGPVRGGRVYGRWPGLAEDDRFEGRDLAVTTDFRDVFGELVTRHLGAAPDALARVFPGHRPAPPLGVLA
jgi:uncharacterized protein (DUF1501 family)